MPMTWRRKRELEQKGKPQEWKISNIKMREETSKTSCQRLTIIGRTTISHKIVPSQYPTRCRREGAYEAASCCLN